MKVITCPNCQITVGVTTNECPSCRNHLSDKDLEGKVSRNTQEDNTIASEWTSLYHDLTDGNLGIDAIRDCYFRQVRDHSPSPRICQLTKGWILQQFIPRWFAMVVIAGVCIYGLIVINFAAWAPIDHAATFQIVAGTWVCRIVLFPLLLVIGSGLLFLVFVFQEHVLFSLASRAIASSSPDVVHDICKELRRLELNEFMSIMSQRDLLLATLERYYSKLQIPVNMSFVHDEIERLKLKSARAKRLRLISPKTGKDHYEKLRAQVHDHLRVRYGLLLKALPLASGGEGMDLDRLSAPK